MRCGDIKYSTKSQWNFRDVFCWWWWGGGGSTNSLLHFHNESICQILWLWRSRLSKLVFDWQIALKLGNLTAFKRVFLAVSMKLVRHAKKLFKKRWRVGEGSFGIRMKKHSVGVRVANQCRETVRAGRGGKGGCCWLCTVQSIQGWWLHTAWMSSWVKVESSLDKHPIFLWKKNRE